MNIYAISDLHLSLANPKPMDIFGPQWINHENRVAEHWDRLVGADDIVLMPGDHSWAMRLEDAWKDLDFIAARPGRKIMIRGNHDYWWSREATTKIQKLVDSSITVLHGKSVVVDGVGIGGTCGWRMEDFEHAELGEGKAKIFARELNYLRHALETIPDGVSTKIAMLHYPPFTLDGHPNEFAEILREFKVDILVYGHIHGPNQIWLEGPVDGMIYHLVAADHIDFTPRLIVG